MTVNRNVKKQGGVQSLLKHLLLPYCNNSTCLLWNTLLDTDKTFKCVEKLTFRLINLLPEFQPALPCPWTSYAVLWCSSPNAWCPDAVTRSHLRPDVWSGNQRWSEGKRWCKIIHPKTCFFPAVCTKKRWQDTTPNDSLLHRQVAVMVFNPAATILLRKAWGNLHQRWRWTGSRFRACPPALHWWSLYQLK